MLGMSYLYYKYLYYSAWVILSVTLVQGCFSFSTEYWHRWTVDQMWCDKVCNVWWAKLSGYGKQTAFSPCRGWQRASCWDWYRHDHCLCGQVVTRLFCKETAPGASVGWAFGGMASWKALLPGALQCWDTPTAGLCWDLEALTHLWHVYLMLFHVIYFTVLLQQLESPYSLLDVWCCKWWSSVLNPAGEQCPQLGAPAVCWDTKQVQPLLRWKVHPLVPALC